METHIVITSGMIETLDLKGNELLAFAMINGYSQNRQGAFLGSISFIAYTLNVTPKTVVNTLNSLVEKGMIDKVETRLNNVRRSEYLVSEEAMKKLHRPCENFTQPLCKNYIASQEEKKEREIKKEIEEHTPSPIVEGVKDGAPSSFDEGVRTPSKNDDGKVAYMPNVRLTSEEKAKLDEKYGADVPWMLERLDSYKADNPRKKYTSDYRVLIGWVAKDLLEYKLAEQRLRNAQEAGARFHPMAGQSPAASALAEAKAMEKALNDK